MTPDFSSAEAEKYDVLTPNPLRGDRSASMYNAEYSARKESTKRMGSLSAQLLQLFRRATRWCSCFFTGAPLLREAGMGMGAVTDARALSPPTGFRQLSKRRFWLSFRSGARSAGVELIRFRCCLASLWS